MPTILDMIGDAPFALVKAQMDEQVTVMKHGTVENEIGEEVAGYTPEATPTDALVLPQSGREIVRSGRVEAEHATIVRMAYRSDLTAKDRLRWDSTELTGAEGSAPVLHIHALENRADQILELTCTMTRRTDG